MTSARGGRVLSAVADALPSLPAGLAGARTPNSRYGRRCSRRHPPERRWWLTVWLIALLLAGCGGGSGDGSKPKPSVAGFRACLDRDEFFRDVRPLDVGQAGRTVLSPRERARVAEAVHGASDALIARAGGPQQVGGTITEAPVRVFELYFFSDPKSVQRRGGQLQSAAGHGALDGARAYGPWVVVHYSYGIGDRPGNVGLGDPEVKPVTDCLREVGYL